MAQRTQYSKKDFLNTYKTESYSYPDDVTTSEVYGGNFAVFFINVQSQSKLLNGDSNFVNDVITGINSNAGNISTAAAIAGQAISGAIDGGLVSAGLGLAGAFKSGISSAAKAGDTGLVNSTKNIAGSVGKLLAAPVAGAALKAGAAGLIANASGEFSQPVKRLKTAISLYMPSSLSASYGVQYNESEVPMGMLVANAVGNMFNGSQPVNKETTEANKTTSGAIGAAIGFKYSGDAAGALSKLSKIAPNPTTEMVFQGVETRTFSFNYRFAPRSEKEAEHVLLIIEQFKFHMHPEFKDVTGFLYIYPSEFDIVYYSGGQENPNLHKHTSCVLVNMAINYTPNGMFSTFDNGMPTQIDVTLSFKELAKLDKQKIQEGKF
jgi:hypothetical protein